MDHAEHPYGVEFIGPFIAEHRVTVDGYRVPHLSARLVPGTEDRWLLTLDERFMVEAPDDEARRWLWFLANAMAVAAGYSCHGEQCRPLNPFTVRMTGLDTGREGGEHSQEYSQDAAPGDYMILSTQKGCVSYLS